MLAGCTNEAEKPSDSQPKQVSQNEENKGNQSGENKGTSENSNNKNQTPASEEKDVFVLNVDGVKKEIKTMDISREFELGTEIVFKLRRNNQRNKGFFVPHGEFIYWIIFAEVRHG